MTKRHYVLFLIFLGLTFAKIFMFAVCFNQGGAVCEGVGEIIYNMVDWVFSLPGNAYAYSGLSMAFTKTFYGPSGSWFNVFPTMFEMIMILVINNLYRYFLACLIAAVIKRKVK